eukprot:scaffold60776_cov16-Tisochrysis_lutea.AAC.2
METLANMFGLAALAAVQPDFKRKILEAERKAQEQAKVCGRRGVVVHQRHPISGALVLSNIC